MRILIHREGLGILIICLAAALLGGLSSFLITWWSYLTVAALSGAVFTAFFFRDPERKVIREENAIIAPADGRIVYSQAVNHPVMGETRLISVFLALWNVHVIRAPVSGKVEDRIDEKGRFLPAFIRQASMQNENTRLTVRREDGSLIVMRLNAGMIVRRIVCPLAPGESMHQGERVGMIRFGSRVDLYIPMSVQLEVRDGDRIKAGLSVIGRFHES